MPIGNMLSANEQQYVALRDSATNTWRILDTWHNDIKSLDARTDVIVEQVKEEFEGLKTIIEWNPNWRETKD